jgi:hypothetical protein
MNKELKDSTVRRTLYPNAIEEQQVNQRSSSSEDGYSKPSSRNNKQATKPLNKTKSEDKDFEKARPKNKKLEYPKNKEMKISVMKLLLNIIHKKVVKIDH